MVVCNFLDIHAALGAGHHHGHTLRAIQHHAEVELLVGFGVGLHDQRLNFGAFGAGLLRLERMLEHRLGDGLHLLLRCAELHATEFVGVAHKLPLTAAAGVNLRLDDHSAAVTELVERRGSFLGGLHDDVLGNVCTGRGEQFLGLVLVDLHRGAAPNLGG